MVYKPIIVVAGEPNSIFSEIFFKSLNYKKFKSPIVLIASQKLIKLQMKKLRVNKKIRLIKYPYFEKYKLDNKKINLIDVNFNQKKAFDVISNKSNNYITKSFDIALKILDRKITNKLINGPISKKFFLKKKYLGITEYLAHRTKTKNFAMLIYNKELSVCPLTTHLPIKKVSKIINLSDDIARSMSVEAVRVAMVPGQNVIGIELPNKSRETVILRNILEHEEFQKSNFKNTKYKKKIR